MTKTLLTTTLVLALGLSASGAQTQRQTDLSANNSETEVALLLPPVRAARGAARHANRPDDRSADKGV